MDEALRVYDGEFFSSLKRHRTLCSSALELSDIRPDRTGKTYRELRGENELAPVWCGRGAGQRARSGALPTLRLQGPPPRELRPRARPRGAPSPNNRKGVSLPFSRLWREERRERERRARREERERFLSLALIGSLAQAAAPRARLAPSALRRQQSHRPRRRERLSSDNPCSEIIAPGDARLSRLLGRHSVEYSQKS